MTASDLFLLCFGIGVLWTLATFILGGVHHHHGHLRFGGHHHLALAALVNPSCLAVFLAWFGAVGYLLVRHSGLQFWIDLVVAVAVGLTGAFALARFFVFLGRRERVLDPLDYDMVGTLGRVSSPIRPNGVGELIYVRDGARRATPARSDDGLAIVRDSEVIVTRFEKGIAYVRTWDAMTR